MQSAKTLSRIAAIIPARYGSTRFPGKALAMIKGKTMIQRVYEQTKKSALVSRVVVATDDQRIFDAVSAFGGEAIMTSGSHQTGTDRIAEAARAIECDIVVNVQGDEPLIQPEMNDEAIAPLAADASIEIGTLCKRIERADEAADPNVVKVVFDKNGFALYFSRAPIPWDRDNWKTAPGAPTNPVYKHIGLYVYRKTFLLEYASLPQTPLEQIEKLEQLRVLENGRRIRVVVTERESFGVDIPADLGKILQHLGES
jgi:3-deoxy-manno-octulosonate cytidylyltransferase (CMP-KDO synthetase)